jgi:hypothetical protein
LSVPLNAGRCKRFSVSSKSAQALSPVGIDEATESNRDAGLFADVSVLPAECCQDKQQERPSEAKPCA